MLLGRRFEVGNPGQFLPDHPFLGRHPLRDLETKHHVEIPSLLVTSRQTAIADPEPLARLGPRRNLDAHRTLRPSPPQKTAADQAIRRESEPNVAMQQKCDKTKPEFWAGLVNMLIY